MNIPPLFQSPSRLTSQLPFNNDGRTAANRSGSSALMDIPSSSSQRQEALQIFERTIAMGYEKLKASQAPAAQFAAFEPLTAEKVAGNILGFIERRLQMDVAQGATQEELSTRLEAGLAGFKKGFAEASEKLKALSMLSPQIEQDISKTYDLVLSGVDTLRQTFLNDAIKADKTNSPQTNRAEAQQQAYAVLANSNYQYVIANNFNFQLVTAEGDKVTISASASRAYAAEYASGSITNSKGSQTAATFRESYSTNDAMSWSIQGDLNENEMQAVNNLLGQVTNLAGSFFKGNLDHAFNQALELGYDEQQITAFSVNLTQVEVQRVSIAYKQFNGAPIENLSNDLNELLLPIGKFIKDLLDTLDDASIFHQPRELLGELSEKMVVQDATQTLNPGKKLRSFIEQVLSGLSKESSSDLYR